MSQALSPSRPRSRTSRSKLATFYVVVGGNDVWWRAEAPAQVVGAKLVRIPEEQMDEIIVWPNSGTVFPWSITMTLADGNQKRILTRQGWERIRSRKVPYRFTKLEAEFPRHEGIAVFQRPGFEQAVLSQSMRAQGIRTLGETDDNYFSDKNLNLAMRHTFNEGHYTQHAKAFFQQDALIFSTEWLRDRYHNEFLKRFGRRGMPDLYVCHNHIPSYAWPERIPATDGRIRVGFMGSPSHVWDVNIAFASFQLAKELGCKTVMIGFNPADPDPGIPDTYTSEDGEVFQLKNPKSVEVSAKWATVIDEHVPWQRPADYHRTALPIDIGLCPILSNDFTMGKSDVKAIEYTISGAAVVCTNNPVYNKFWKHEETCLMANSYKEMAAATVRLIRDPKLRFELVSNAQEKLQAERSEKQMKAEWTDAILG